MPKQTEITIYENRTNTWNEIITQRGNIFSLYEWLPGSSKLYTMVFDTLEEAFEYIGQ